MPDSLLSGLAAFGSAFVNPMMQWQQNQWNAQQMERQNQWNIEQWQRENAYNTPLAQMQRLAAAGINPALAYSNGNLMNEAAASPAMEASQGKAPQFDPYIFSQIALNEAQIRNIDADTRNKDADTQGKEISNILDGMKKDAFKSAYDEGLVHSAVKAGFRNDIFNSNISTYEFLSAAWDFAVYTGVSYEDAVNTGYDFDETRDGDTSRIVVPPFSQERFDTASSLFVSAQDAQQKANEAAKFVSELNMSHDQKDKEIWDSLNKAADDGNIFARIARVGFWILEQKWQKPGFAFDINASKRNVFNDHYHNEEGKKTYVFTK